MDLNNCAACHSRLQRKVEQASARKRKTDFNFACLPFISAGIAFIAWGIFGNKFRDAENVLTAEFCLPAAIGAGLLLVGFLINGKLKTSAAWTALALVGQAASLQMIEAGRLIHFRHYRTLTELIEKNPWSLCIIAFQIFIVAAATAKYIPRLKEIIYADFTKPKLFIIALFMIFAAAAVTPNLSIYAASLGTGGIIQAVSLANILLIIASLPLETVSRMRRKFQNIFRTPKAEYFAGIDRFALAAAVWITIIAAGLNFFVYNRHAHVPDETQYLFQAEYMAAGRLTVKAPPVPEAFAMYMVPHADDNWFSIFPPGYPALLAVGEKLNAAWLVNPILAGFCVILAYLFFREIYSLEFARFAIFLLSCSPWFIFMAMSFMSHIFTLFCALSASVLLLAAFKNTSRFYVFASGLLIGIVSLIRPLDGAIVAVLLGIWTVLRLPTIREKFVGALLLAIGTAATASLVFPYNYAVTGNMRLMPMEYYYTKYFHAGVMDLGFGANRGFSWGLDAFPGHSPLEALINAALNVFSVNTELFGWATGSLIFVAAFVVSGKLRKKDFWALAAIGAIITAYGFYWYHGGPDFGARYWFLCIVPLIALTVAAVEYFSRKMTEAAKTRFLSGVVILCLISLFNCVSWLAADKYYNYLGVRSDIADLAREYKFGKSLILIRGEESPDYQAAWIYNPLNFEGDAPIYAWDKSPEIRNRLLQAFPDRKVWIIDGPTRTGAGYKIVQTPPETDLSASQTNQ